MPLLQCFLNPGKEKKDKREEAKNFLFDSLLKKWKQILKIELTNC